MRCACQYAWCCCCCCRCCCTVWFAADHRPHHPPLIWSGRKLSDLICRMGCDGASVPSSSSGSRPRRCLQHKPLSSTRCATSSEPLKSHNGCRRLLVRHSVHATHVSYKSLDTSASLPMLPPAQSAQLAVLLRTGRFRHSRTCPWRVPEEAACACLCIRSPGITCTRVAAVAAHEAWQGPRWERPVCHMPILHLIPLLFTAMCT
jgi:hypothetical protein